MACRHDPRSHNLERFLGDLRDEYLGSPNTGLIDWFAAQRPARRTGVLSNGFVGARERERYGFEELTDVIVYSHEIGIAKPEPEAYLLACERLDVARAEAVFLDGHESAVAGAHAVGMRAVLCRDNAQALADLEALLRLNQ